MTPDPRWLEVLKASGWQTGMLALACLVFLILAGANAVHTDPWMVTLAAAATLFFIALWLASVGKTVASVRHWIRRRFAVRRARRAVADYIPYMTPKERRIFAYLLHHKQKSFSCDL